MTYDAKETSAQDGQPVELYEFIQGPNTFRYTSWDIDVVHATKTYLAESISRSEFENTGEFPRNDIDVTAPTHFPVSRLFRFAPPSQVVLLVISEIHNTDLDAEKIVKWRGRVLNVDWSEGNSVLHCENIYTTLRSPGLRRKYQRGCPHVLYGPACKVVDTAHKVVASLTVVNGISLTSPTFDLHADTHFDGGFLEWEYAPGLTEKRAIRSHIGDTITITHPIPGLESGASIDAYPGCDHTLPTCDSKFSNSENYGGFPDTPQQNPFGGDSVF